MFYSKYPGILERVSLDPSSWGYPDEYLSVLTTLNSQRPLSVQIRKQQSSLALLLQLSNVCLGYILELFIVWYVDPTVPFVPFVRVLRRYIHTPDL